MFNKNDPFIGLIPARSGSKGLIGKNMRIVGARPLIMHTALAASNCSLLDRTYISSDDSDILQTASFTKCVPLHRPREIAEDETTAAEVVRHLLSHLNFIDLNVVYLQPTSPLRTTSHIQAAIELFAQNNYYPVVSVSPDQQSPYKCFRLGEDGRLVSLFKENYSNCRRQDLPSTYSANGAIYIFSASSFLKTGEFPSEGAIPYLMSENDSVDIDGADDLRRANDIFSERL